MSILPTSEPPLLAVIDTQELRRRLAGLADPFSSSADTDGERVDIADTAIRFGTILAHLFSDDLDRLTLWTRIESALDQACAKVGGTDLEHWINLCLEHVKADAAKTAACEPLVQMIQSIEVRPAQWKHAFLAYVRSRRYVVVVKARARWEQVKSKECDL